MVSIVKGCLTSDEGQRDPRHDLERLAHADHPAMYIAIISEANRPPRACRSPRTVPIQSESVAAENMTIILRTLCGE